MPAVAFCWRNDTHICHSTVLLPKTVVPELVGLRHVSLLIYLFFFEFKFITVAPLTNATPALSTLQ